MKDFPALIKNKRLVLGESQAEFATRFNTQANTVSRWESGQYQAPYEVLSFVLEDKPSHDLIYVCWANEPGFKLQVYRGSHGRVNFLMVDEVNKSSFQVSIEKHHVQNLAKGLREYEKNSGDYSPPRDVER